MKTSFFQQSISWCWAFSLLFLTVSCGKLEDPAQVSLRYKNISVSALAASPQGLDLSENECFAIHVTGDSPSLRLLPPSSSQNSACPLGPQGLGQLNGLYHRGDTATLSVPSGLARRFDLVAIKKTALPSANNPCHGSITGGAPNVTAALMSPDFFVASTKIDSSAMRLVATGTADLVPGANVVTIEKVADAGAYSCGTQASTPPVDNTPPSSLSISINAGSPITRFLSVSLSLNAVDATEMYVTNDSSCTAGGNWQTLNNTVTTWSLASANANNNVYVTFRDVDGNLSSCVSDSILHDNTAPTGVAFNSNAVTVVNASNNENFWVYGSCSVSDPAPTIEVSTDNNNWSEYPSHPSCGGGASASFSLALDLSPYSDGTLYLRLVQTDLAGNSMMASLPGVLTKDTVAPASPTFSSASSASPSNNLTPNLMGSAPVDTANVLFFSDATCATQIGSGPVSSFAAAGIALSSLAPNSMTTIYAKGVDGVGNSSACVHMLNYTTDTIAPVLSFSGVSSSITSANQTSFVIGGSCESGLNIVVTLMHSNPSYQGSLPNISPSGCAAGVWSTNVNFAGLPNSGTIAVSATSIDAAGNQGSATLGTPLSKSVSLDVQPAFSNAQKWAEFVSWSQSGDYAQTSPSAPVCASTIGGYRSCLHGGEIRKVVLHGINSCSYVTAFVDSLGAFEWDCRIEGSNVVAYSRRLKESKGLADLIDWTVTPVWKNVFVSATIERNFGSGSVNWTLSSLPAPWATNSIAQLQASNSSEFSSSTGNAILSPGFIYTVKNSLATFGHKLNTGASLVVQPGAILSLSSGAPGPLADANSGGSPTDFHWFEGNYACHSGVNGNGISLTSGVRFNVLRRVNIINCRAMAIQVNGPNNWFSQIRISNAGSASTSKALMLNYGNWNTFDDIRVYSTAGTGIYLYGSNNNTFGNVISANNGGDGIGLASTSNNNSFSGLTLAQNFYDGLSLDASNSNVFHNMISMNNGAYGVHLANTSTNNTFSQLVSMHNPTNIYLLSGTPNNRFTGNLVLGQHTTANCNSPAASGINNACTPSSGVSDAAVVTSALPQDSAFVGVVNTDDPVNPSDSAGYVSAPTSSIYANPPQAGAVLFSNPWRVWAQYYNSTPFLVSNRRASCAQVSCQINDWSLVVGSSRLFNRSDDASNAGPTPFVATDGDSCPSSLSGNITLSSSSGLVYLKNAVEKPNDRMGNENGLCESGESCFYTPNFGAYQGHGFVNKCSFSSGSIANVEMMGYRDNGF